MTQQRWLLLCVVVGFLIGLIIGHCLTLATAFAQDPTPTPTATATATPTGTPIVAPWGTEQFGGANPPVGWSCITGSCVGWWNSVTDFGIPPPSADGHGESVGICTPLIEVTEGQMFAWWGGADAPGGYLYVYLGSGCTGGAVLLTSFAGFAQPFVVSLPFSGAYSFGWQGQAWWVSYFLDAVSIGIAPTFTPYPDTPTPTATPTVTGTPATATPTVTPGIGGTPIAWPTALATPGGTIPMPPILTPEECTEPDNIFDVLGTARWYLCQINGFVRGLYMPSVPLDTRIRTLMRDYDDRFPLSVITLLTGVNPGGCYSTVNVQLGPVILPIASNTALDTLGTWAGYLLYLLVLAYMVNRLWRLLSS